MIIAQVFAFIAFVLYVASLQFKKKEKVLKFQMIANTFYALEYLMLNAYAGVNNSLFGISRSVIFYVCHKKKMKFPLYGAVIFVVLVLIFGYMSYVDVYSIIPVAISIAFFLALYIGNMRAYRIIAALASTSWIVYNVHVEAYISVIDAAVELISALIAIYRIDLRRVKVKKFGYWQYYR
jgi:hypothetical protein